ncbi:MAG: PspC domain-containing protein [Bacteroidetes bacterium]|nr:PspC domain-containing protein [Bacteroidota bacterium]
MNKTVTINISGIIFHIEEDAYERLSKYLSTIKGYFSKTDGGNEIMSDIEARIAEMLQSRTSPVKQVVLMADVDFVIGSMGRPEDFAGDQEFTEKEQTKQETVYEEPVKRRLFRDPDSKVIGGVCGGIGNYFDFDPTFLRIILALVAFFSFGSLIIVYIILWIAIPEAVTTADKLAMKGERIDINNISKTVQEEAEQLKKRMEKYGDDVKDFAKNNRHIPRNGFEKFMGFLLDVFRAVSRVFAIAFSIFIILFGSVVLFVMIATLFGFTSIGPHQADIITSMFLLDGQDFYLGTIGAFLTVVIPVAMLMYWAIKLLFKIKYSNMWINMTAGIIWFIGLMLALYVGVRTGRDFSQEGKIRETLVMKPYDTLRLALNSAEINWQEYNIDTDNIEKNMGINHDEYEFGSKNGVNYLFGNAELNVIKAQGNTVELVVVKSAKGWQKKDAMDRARHIEYRVTQKDSLLLFDNVFKVGGVDKFRMQEVKVILKLPVNKVIYLDKSLENLIYDIENVHNTLDSEMLNRRWIMTDDGLRCIDCNGLDIDELDELKDLNIDLNGVNIKSKDSKIKIDSDGVNVNGKHTSIKIDETGIHVKKH